MTTTADVIAYWKDVGADRISTDQPQEGSDRIKVPPLRSGLYVPGNKPDWLRNAPGTGTDAVVVELEDAVQEQDKPAARETASREIAGLAAAVRSVWVRVNNEPQHLQADLESVVVPGLSVVQLPKVSSASDVLDVDDRISYLEGRAGLPHRSIAISPIIETAAGIEAAYEIAKSSPRVEYLGALISPMGDTALALGARVMSDRAWTESLYVRSRLLVAARAAGIRYPLCGIVTALDDDHSAVREFASRHRDIGYAGILVIHPGHVPVANEVFSPSEAELDGAAEVLFSLWSAASRNRGSARIGGGAEMIDLAHVRYSMRTLETAQDLGIPLPQAPTA